LAKAISGAKTAGATTARQIDIASKRRKVVMAHPGIEVASVEVQHARNSTTPVAFV
jgi:hypothetical protein